MYDEIPSELLELDFSAPKVPEFSELEASYEKLDSARGLFLDACAEHADDPLAENEADVHGYANEVVSNFHKSVEVIQRTLSPTAAMDAVFGLIVSQDSAYIARLKSLADSKNLDYISKKSLHDEIEKIVAASENDEDFAEKITSSFGKALRWDISKFFENIVEKDKLRQAHTRAITIGRVAMASPYDDSTEDGETYSYYPLMIEPPIQPHTSDFMGRDVEFDYSDASATHGKFWVADSYEKDTDPDEREEKIQDNLIEIFRTGLNSLRTSDLQFTWVDNSPDENSTTEADS